jgi:hypothetical protein
MISSRIFLVGVRCVPLGVAHPSLVGPRVSSGKAIVVEVMTPRLRTWVVGLDSVGGDPLGRVAAGEPETSN